MDVDQRILFSEIRAHFSCTQQDLNIYFLFSETLLYFWDLLHQPLIQGLAFECTPDLNGKLKKNVFLPRWLI